MSPGVSDATPAAAGDASKRAAASNMARSGEGLPGARTRTYGCGVGQVRKTADARPDAAVEVASASRGGLIAQRFRRLVSLVRKDRRCPFCGWRGYRFEPFGNRVLHRADARCPICWSLERHRVARILLGQRLAGPYSVLHMAPEALIVPWLVGLSYEYLNADLHNPAMRKMDLTDTGLPNSSRSLIWCSHVLEHIENDAAALAEMFRVLSPGGLLVLQVPIGGDETLEDAAVSSDEQRLQRFLQEDHVRLYGRDIVERIAAAGFNCEMLSAKVLPAADRALYAIDHPVFREVFLCRRPE
jgi:SAM-dependent methyltransferase